MGIVFINCLSKDSRGGVSSSQVTATAADVLENTTYVGSDTNNYVGNGTMPNNGAVNVVINSGDVYVIPRGYHNGQGTVTTKSLASQTSGTATADDILEHKTAYVNGEKVTGTMPNNGNVSATLNCGQTYTIPAGFHSGEGVVSVNPLASQTSANADSVHIQSGYTAYVNGQKITGTLPYRGTYQYGNFVYVNSTYCVINQFPEGIYDSEGNSWAPEARVKMSQVASVLGLTADKIKKGVWILGILGTWQGY